MKKEKKLMGVGSLALLFAFLGAICLFKVNGESLYNYLFDLIDLNSQYINSIIFIVFSILGLLLGILKKQHWGAKIGLIWCILNLIGGSSEIKNLFS